MGLEGQRGCQENCDTCPDRGQTSLHQLVTVFLCSIRSRSETSNLYFSAKKALRIEYVVHITALFYNLEFVKY